MLKTRGLLFALLLFVSSFIALSQSKVDSLIAKYNSALSDTTRVRLCIDISKQHLQTSPEISIDWLNKALVILNSCKGSPTDTLKCPYFAETHIELAKVYIYHNRHSSWALAHLDTAKLALECLIKESSKKKNIELLAAVYSTKGRTSLNKGDLNDAIDSYTTATKLLESIGNEDGTARMYNNLGVLHRRQSSYAQSLHFFHKALDFFEKKNDSILIASVLTNIGSVSFDIGAYEKSLETYLKALQIIEKSDNLEALASTLVNIGGVMVSSQNSKEGNSYYHRAYKLYEKLNNKRGIATCYLSLGISYKEQNNLDSAFTYLTNSLNVYREIGDKVGEADSHQHLGEVYLKQMNYSMAHLSFNNSLVIAKEINLNSVVANVNHNLSKVLFGQGRISSSYTKALHALDLSKKYGLLSLQKDIHLTLSKILEKNSDYRNSLIHFKLFFSLYDSIYSNERSHRFAEMQTLYQLEQKQAAIVKLQKEKENQEMELRNAELQILWQKTQSYITLGVLLLLTIILYLLYRQFRFKRLSNNLLKEQNAQILMKNEEITAQKEQIELQRNEVEKQKGLLKEKSEQLEKFNWLITDSIDYASSIQSALLPAPEVFSRYFDDSFVMYFPKDVVSGDFYWAHSKSSNVIVALADCTGHGVPGGFMSMLGISALTELMGRQITEPSDILDNLRLLVIESLKQTGKIGEHQEGMDISVISYRKGNDFIDFAGANQPLWLVRKGEDGYKINEFKGDRMPISYHQRMEPFKCHRIPIQKGDQIYLFSDGYRHQLGGDNFDVKFGKEKFQKLFLDNAHLPMDNQKSIIEDTFFRWVSGFDQLDDITVLGLKI